MSFYKSGLYSFLRENREKHCFRLLSENIGVLIIFNTSNLMPMCILIESWIYNMDLNTDLSNEENDAIRIAENLCLKTNIPYYFFRYSGNYIDLESRIGCYINGQYNTTMTISDFFKNLQGFQITNLSKTTTKEINSRCSTPFHEWQRKHLIYNGFPIDIDMYFDNNQTPFIVEIKRSYIKNWKPYKDDAMNYLAMCKFCDLAGINFLLLFIQQEKNEEIIIDDYQNMTFYNVFHRIGNYLDPNTLFFGSSMKIKLEDLLTNHALQFLFLPNKTWKER